MSNVLSLSKVSNTFLSKYAANRSCGTQSVFVNQWTCSPLGVVACTTYQPSKLFFAPFLFRCFTTTVYIMLYICEKQAICVIKFQQKKQKKETICLRFYTLFFNLFFCRCSLSYTSLYSLESYLKKE